MGKVPFREAEQKPMVGRQAANSTAAQVDPS
jgi:hypothetical protein